MKDILDRFTFGIENFIEEGEKYGIDEFNIICRWPKTIHLEILDGIITRVCVGGVFDEINPNKSTQTPWNTSLWDWWDAATLCVSNPRTYGDLDLILYNIKGKRDIEYGIKPTEGLLKDCYLYAVINNNVVLGWEQTSFIALFLGIPLVPILKIGKITTTRIEYFESLEHTLDSPSIFGSISTDTSQPVGKKGILIRNYDSFSLDNLGQSMYKTERGSKNTWSNISNQK